MPHQCGNHILNKTLIFWNLFYIGELIGLVVVVLKHLWSPSATECCNRLKWHSLATRRDITCLLLAHYIIQNNSCTPQYKLRVSSRSSLLRCQSSSINAFCYPYFVNIPFIWNKLDRTLLSII